MDVEKLIFEAEQNLKSEFMKIDNLVLDNSKKVLEAFHKFKVSESHFATTTGYGYGDI